MIAPRLSDDRRLAQFRKLTEVSRALTYAVSLDDVLRLTVSRAAELLEAEKAVLMLTNADGFLSVRAAHGLDAQTTSNFREPLDETLIHRLQGLLEVDADHFLGVPLVVSGQVTGILAVPVQAEAATTEESEWLLSALADQAAVALEKTRLDEAGRFRERVIGIVSHDLRNPMNAILLGAGILLQDDNLDERTIKIVARIRSSAERGGRLIRDLLDYTQAHLGNRIPVVPRGMDMAAVLRQVVDEARVIHPHRSIALEVGGDVHGQWDPDRIIQIAENLIANAIAYSPRGTQVSVEVDGLHEKWIELRVHNEGPGIPQDRLPFIFEPMQRATSDADSSRRSVGLGLYIVKHLVEAHGGAVDVASADGPGTTFTARLPRR